MAIQAERRARRSCVLAAGAAIVGLACCLGAGLSFVAGSVALRSAARDVTLRVARYAEKVQKDTGGGMDDTFIDKTFTIIADMLVQGMPLAKQEKDAYQFYRDGLAAQTGGDYSSALRCYAEALKLEEDPTDRSFIFYNLGIIFGSNGEYVKAVKYYHLALDQNKEMPQSYNNIAVIYQDQGARAERKGSMDKARILYDKAALYWNNACRIAPTNYLEAQNWLRERGQLTSVVANSLGGIF